MNVETVVHVVDDEKTVRDSLCWLLEALRINVQAYASAYGFLSAYDPIQPGCLILDVRMPDIGGLELQEILAQRNIHIPIIMITGHGDISMAVRAMKAGAYDFIEKPFNDQLLLERVQQGLATDIRRHHEIKQKETILECLHTLTPRETEVLDCVVHGMANKLIAYELGISIKTVEVHRARVMNKMSVNSVAELTALCHDAGICKGKPVHSFRQDLISKTN